MAVAEARSFRIAADRLGMSQPALSQNIAQLEAHLATSLFLRSTRSVRLTAEGAELHRNLSKALPALHEALDRTRNFGTEAAVTLRLGFLASAAVKYLPHALRCFRREFPEIRVHARDDTAEGLFAAVHQGELDLAVSSYLPHKNRDVDFHLIRADPFMAVMRRDHRLAGRAEVSWSELLEDDFIGAKGDSGTRYVTDAAMKSINSPARTVMDFNHFLAVAGMIEAGFGVSALPMVNCPAPDHPTLCAVRLVDPVVTRDLGLLTRSADGATSRHVRGFQQCIVEAAAIAHGEVAAEAGTTGAGAEGKRA